MYVSFAIVVVICWFQNHLGYTQLIFPITILIVGIFLSILFTILETLYQWMTYIIELFIYYNILTLKLNIHAKFAKYLVHLFRTWFITSFLFLWITLTLKSVHTSTVVKSVLKGVWRLWTWRRGECPPHAPS